MCFVYPLMIVFWLKFRMDGKISSRSFQQVLLHNFMSYSYFSMIFQNFMEYHVFVGFSGW